MPRISALPSGTVANTDTVPVVKSGVTTQVTFGHTHPQSDITGLTAALAAVLNVHGFCRLQVDSTTSITLQRYQGTTLPIKTGSTWGVMTIPTSGPALSNSGLTADTLYYVYAFNSSGTLTLEASTTTHAVDTDTGVEIKSGDASRTLVGMIRTGSGSPGTFVDSVTRRFLRNWFNRESAATESRFTVSRNTNSGTFVELNSEIRVELLSWATENIRAEHSGVVNSGGSTWYARVGLDSTPTFLNGGVSETVAGVGHNTLCVGHGYIATPSEGYHFLSLYARTDGGSGHTWLGGTATDESVNSLRAWVEQD